MQVNYTNSRAANRPADHVLEVTVFGPGHGEAILLHVGSGNWIAVDCCKRRSVQTPAPLEYLESIGVDPSSALRLVVATHWHDDHIKGLARLLDSAPNAAFACPLAFQDSEFVAFLAAYNSRPMTVAHAGAQELKAVFGSLIAGKKDVRWAKNRTLLFQIDGSELAHGETCQVWALSPNDDQIREFLGGVPKISKLIGRTKKRATSEHPNHASLVMAIVIGERGILLGGDLENIPERSDLGWPAVINCAERPKTRSHIFKIPHHGSNNAHTDEVWSSMLHGNPLSIVTPYSKLKDPLPRPADLQRIAALTNNGAYTSLSATKKFKHADYAVERAVLEAGAKVRTLKSDVGLVSARLQVSGPIDVSLSGTASRIS